MLTSNEIQEFQSLIDDWGKESIIQSGLCHKYEPYLKVIEIAKTNKQDYLPLIFTALKKDFRWYKALQIVIGDAPKIPSKDIGYVNRIIEIWIQFGKDKGFIE